MVYSNNFLVSFVYFFLIGLAVSTPVNAQSIDNMKIMKISSVDETAVIKDDTGKAGIVRVGDIVMENFIIEEISENRMILKNLQSEIGEKIIFYIKGCKQIVERITTHLPETDNQYYQSVMISNKSSER